MNVSLQSIFSLEGKTALVTGSSRGIGAAIARSLAAAGADVIIHGTTMAGTKATERTIRADGGKAHVLAGDLSIRGSGKLLIEEAGRLSGQLDILVINASAQINASLEELSLEDLDAQVAVNLRSMIEMLQACLPSMAEQGWGRVVNIGSINQLRPKGVVTAYAATKAAGHNIVQSQARDYAKRGVLLNTLAPGLIDTDRNADRRAADPEKWEMYTSQLNWLGRAGRPEEIVGAAIFLSSNACSFMTGETLLLSGGY